MTCIIIGDSIAVGLAQQFPACEVRAHVGWPSGRIARLAGGSFSWAVISAGSNDPANRALKSNLEALRAHISGRVVWIAPVNGRAAFTVRAVAAERGDSAVAFAPGADHVHPRSYAALAASVRAGLYPSPSNASAAVIRSQIALASSPAARRANRDASFSASRMAARSAADRQSLNAYFCGHGLGGLSSGWQVHSAGAADN